MSRRSFRNLVLCSGLILAACTSDQSPLPVEPPSLSLHPGDAVTLAKIERLILVLYPRPNFRPGQDPNGFIRVIAQARFAKLIVLVAKNQMKEAQQEMFSLVDFTLKNYRNHQLVGDQSPETRANLQEFVNLLFKFIGLAPPGDILGGLQPGGVAVVIAPTDPPVVAVTDDRQAGVAVGTGAISPTQTVLLTVEPDPDFGFPFPETELDQFPPFFVFETFPHVARFAQKVVVGACIDLPVKREQADRLQLAHAAPNSNGARLEILARVDAGFLQCNTTINLRRSPLNFARDGWKGVAGGLATRVLEAIQPGSLHAALIFGGLGGATESFSEFRAVDPGKLVFTGQPSNAAPGAMIAPPVVVTVQKEDGSTIASVAGTATVAIAGGTGTPGAVLSGTTTGTFAQGSATFADLSVSLPGVGYSLSASAALPNGGVPQPGTSATFDIQQPIRIDGAMLPGEWDAARQYPFIANLPDGGTTPATLFVTSDASNIYVAVRLARTVADRFNSITLDFDNNDDGVPRNGDEALLLKQEVGEGTTFIDEFRTNVPPCGEESPEGSCDLRDTEHGGTTDGLGAFGNDGTFSVFELSHPLNSGDSGHDFALAPGGTVGMALQLQLVARGADFPAGYGQTTVPTEGFFHIPIAH